MSTDEPLIHLENLGKTYGKGLLRKGFRAIDGVSLDVGRGTVFGLLGPNGAGKTTLIKVLLGLVRGHDGEARLFGRRPGDPASRKRIGYLPEAHRLPGYLTGRQVMELFGMMCGRPRSFVRDRVPKLLERVEMTQAADRKVREYSKGMQQRIGLAQAMVHEPDLIFLDEPTDGVDPVGRAAIRKVVEELKARGVTLFINSHLLMEVELMCDRVVIMHKGRIIREGSIEELTPRTEAVHFELASAPDDLAAILDGIGTGFAPAARGVDLVATDEELDVAVDRLRAAGVSIRGISRRRLTLEQSFIDLVQKERA